MIVSEGNGSGIILKVNGNSLIIWLLQFYKVFHCTLGELFNIVGIVYGSSDWFN